MRRMGIVFILIFSLIYYKYMNSVIKSILSRASVRDYIDKKIPKEDLELIVKAGMSAPSAMNAQPWRIVVVTDRELLNKLASKLLFAKMLKKASVAIVVCGEIGINPFAKSYWSQDCSACTENILIALHSMGYGGVWTAVFPDEKKEESVRKVLEIPSKVRVLNVIAMGVPKGKVKAKEKFDKKKLHWEKW